MKNKTKITPGGQITDIHFFGDRKEDYRPYANPWPPNPGISGKAVAVSEPFGIGENYSSEFKPRMRQI